MRRVSGAIGSAILVVLLAGCAVKSMPTYVEVTAQTKASLQHVIDQLPAGTTSTFRPEGEPYPCSDSSPPKQSAGYFFTGDVDVTLPPGTDTAAVVSGLLEQLGDEWQEVSMGLALSIPAVTLRDTATGVQVNVLGSSAPDAALSLFLSGISECGSVPDDGQ